MMLNNPLFERSLLVFGEDGINSLIGSHVLVAGVGGVGGFVIEALARAGVGKLTIVDHDKVSSSNMNRQIIALSSTLGQNKAVVMKQRILDINPDCDVEVIQSFLKPEDMDGLLSQPYDYVVDAIDSLNCKVNLVSIALQKGYKVIASMGAGRRVDPTKILMTDLNKTHTCGLARQVRQRLRKQGYRKGLTVVFSTELPKAPGLWRQ
jgi:Dinucleotide-utilizing enzymes involved in molybdopterin and thiamine biosynthesis family 1